MKFKHLFLVATLALLGFAACEPEEKDLGAPAATLSTQSVTIAQNIPKYENKTICITAKLHNVCSTGTEASYPT